MIEALVEAMCRLRDPDERAAWSLGFRTELVRQRSAFPSFGTPSMTDSPTPDLNLSDQAAAK